jgi:hypothetical protein
MKHIIWLIIAAALIAGCMADNDTIRALQGVTLGEVLHSFDIEIQSPPSRPVAPGVPLPTPTNEAR